MSATEFASTFIAGALGGIGCVACGQPFDTVKTKMQTFPELYQKDGFARCMVSIYKTEGLRGLYAGSVGALLTNCAENSILFSARSSTIAGVALFQKKNKNELSNLEMAVAGSGAAFFSSIAVCPTEMIKNRMQATAELQKSGKFSFKERVSVSSTVRQILSEGYTAPFRGLVGTWGREMPGYLVLFYSFAFCQNIFAQNTEMSSGINAALSGGIAGGAYWLCMLPIDVVKSRQQVLSIGSKDPIRFLDCVKDINRISGLRGFYAGLTPMLIRTIPANGALFSIIDVTTPLIERIFS